MTSLARTEQPATKRPTLSPSSRPGSPAAAAWPPSTAGVAHGFVQGNLAILPRKARRPFHRFCQLNPKPCPIIGMSDVGIRSIPALGVDLDIRTDVPRYRVWRDGEVVEEPTDVTAHWRDDLVDLRARLLVLVRGGAARRRACRSATSSSNVRVPMYRTNIACGAAGSVRRSDGGVDAAVQAGGCDPRGADHLALIPPCTARPCISAIRI